MTVSLDDLQLRPLPDVALQALIRRVEANPDDLREPQVMAELGRSASSFAKEVILAALEQESRGQLKPDWARLFEAAGCATLYQSKNLSINLYSRMGVSEHIYWTSRHCSYRAITGRLKVDRWQIPPRLDNEVFVEGLTLDPMRRSEEWLEPGEGVGFDGRSEVFAAQFENPERSHLAMGIFGPPTGTLCWLFDRKTLVSKAAIAADLVDTMKQVLLEGAASLEYLDDSSVIERLSRDKSHFVRWTALQALGILDPDRARARLREMTDDPHILIRQMAGRILASEAVSHG